MTATAPSETLVTLASRLTEPGDRETYAGLISYFASLPPADELFRLAQLLGLLSLLGQRVPEAVADLLTELREQTNTASEYHAQVDRRLSRLPREIAEGIDADAIVRAISESFRQQLAATGMRDATALLNSTARDSIAVSSQISAAVKTVVQEYKSISATVSAELAKLITGSRQLQEHNAELVEREHSNILLWQGLLAMVLFLVGGLCGIVIENRQTGDDIRNIYAQIERIRTPQISVVSVSSKNSKQDRPGSRPRR